MDAKLKAIVADLTHHLNAARAAVERLAETDLGGDAAEEILDEMPGLVSKIDGLAGPGSPLRATLGASGQQIGEDQKRRLLEVRRRILLAIDPLIM